MVGISALPLDSYVIITKVFPFSSPLYSRANNSHKECCEDLMQSYGLFHQYCALPIINALLNFFHSHQ